MGIDITKLFDVEADPIEGLEFLKNEKHESFDPVEVIGKVIESAPEVIQEKAKKLVRVTDHGVEVIDEGLMADLRKKNFSASMISSFAQCPADWLMESFILKLIEHEETPHLLRGHIFHKIMENFFALPESERTYKTLSVTASATMKEEYPEQIKDAETMTWVKTALQGYVKMGFRPWEERIAELEVVKRNRETGEETVSLKPGLEAFVSGYLPGVERKIVGLVDKILDHGEAGLYIEDWKTGKKISPFDPNKPIGPNNDFGYWRQQLLYAILLEQQGHKIAGARLTFPIAGGIVEVDTKNQALRDRVVEDIQTLNAQYEKCLETRVFPFKAHMFCQWCGTLSAHFKAPRRPLQLNKSELVQYVEFQ